MGRTTAVRWELTCRADRRPGHPGWTTVEQVGRPRTLTRRARRVSHVHMDRPYERISLTLEEAAGAVGFSVKTLRGAIACGDLIAHRRSASPNSKYVLLVDDLKAWVESLPSARE